MSIADDLQKLDQLRQSGALNDDEFALAKARLLSPPPETAAPGPVAPPPLSLERQTRQWAFLLHLSMLAGFLLPLAGLIVPIVIWQLNKAELPGLDPHGKNAVNWIITEVIYALLGGLLVFFTIGIPLLIVVSVLGIVFPIIAAIKANNGEVWKYPLAISFLK
jgi:uncharacterized Tic20 family protein